MSCANICCICRDTQQSSSTVWAVAIVETCDTGGHMSLVIGKLVSPVNVSQEKEKEKEILHLSAFVIENPSTISGCPAASSNVPRI